MRYRKSKNAGPFRFTLSSRGISSSVGFGPLRLTRGASGRISRTIRIPRTGLSSTKTLGRQSRRPSRQAQLRSGRRHHHAGRVVLLSLLTLALIGQFPWILIVLAVGLVVVCAFMGVKRLSRPTVAGPSQTAVAPVPVARPPLESSKDMPHTTWGPPITAPRNGPFGTRFR